MSRNQSGLTTMSYNDIREAAALALVDENHNQLLTMQLK
jgi:hypothetical protein